MLLKTLSVAVVCLSIPLWADPVMVVSKTNADVTFTPSKSFKYEPASVQRYNEKQDLMSITGVSGTIDTDIQLNRSFGDEIRQNVDKETVERVVE
jgi:hypothetical protein